MTRRLPVIIATLLLAGAWSFHAGTDWLADISRKERLEREEHRSWIEDERRRQCRLAFPQSKQTQQACTEGRL